MVNLLLLLAAETSVEYTTGDRLQALIGLLLIIAVVYTLLIMWGNARDRDDDDGDG